MKVGLIISIFKSTRKLFLAMNFGFLIFFCMSFCIVTAYSSDHHHAHSNSHKHRRSHHSRREKNSEKMLTPEQANAMREAASMLKSELDSNPVMGVPASLETIKKFLEDNMFNVFRLQGVATDDARRSIPWNTLGGLTSSVLKNVMNTINAKNQMNNQRGQGSSESNDLEEAQRLKEIARIMLDIAALLEESTKTKPPAQTQAELQAQAQQQEQLQEQPRAQEQSRAQALPHEPPQLQAQASSGQAGGLFYPKTHENYNLHSTNLQQKYKPFNYPEQLIKDINGIKGQANPIESYVMDNGHYQDINNKEWQHRAPSQKKVLGVGLIETGNENLNSNLNSPGLANLNASSLANPNAPSLANPNAPSLANPNAPGLTKEDYYNELSHVIMKYQNAEGSSPAVNDPNKKYQNIKNILEKLRRMNDSDE